MTYLEASLKSLRNRTAVTAGACILFAALAGAVWGLGLARALADSFASSPTFELVPTLLCTLGAAAIAAGLGWTLIRRSSNSQGDGQNRISAFVPLLLVLIYILWPEVAPQVGWSLLGGSLALAVLLALRQAQLVSVPYSLIVGLLLACVTFVLYLRTLGPTVGQADSFEFQVVAPTLGIAHPTGYPLYILSGKLFSLLPIGSVAWRVNLTSAVFGVAAVIIVYLLIHRLTSNALAALVAALTLAFSRVFWSQAVVAEVYTLHNMFVGIVLFLLLIGMSGKWPAKPAEVAELHKTRVTGARAMFKEVLDPLYLLALLLGLSMANHLTTVLLFPAVLVTAFIVRPRLRWWKWLLALGFFLLGIAFYGYIYVRWPALHNGVWMSPGAFWHYVTGQQFGGALRLDAWRSDATRYEIVGRLLREAYGLPALILSAAGLIWLAVKNWRAAAVAVLTFVAYVWYALSYYVPDVSVFLLPAHLVLAVWLGIGMAAIMAVLGSRTRHPRSLGSATFLGRVQAAVTVVAISLFALLPLWLMWSNLSEVDQSDRQDAYIWGDRVLDLPLTRQATVLADSVRIAPLYYLQRIEGRRPDLDLLVLADEATYRAELETRLAAGQTVYLARFLPGLEGLYHLRSLGPLTEVSMEPALGVPHLDGALGIRFHVADTGQASAEEETIELLGFSGPAPGPDGGTGLTLYWQSAAPLDKIYQVRLRAVDREGRVWWQEDARHAVNNYYPTLAWRPGEVVADYHEIPPLASGSAVFPSEFTVQVGLFYPFSDQGLVAETGEPWYSFAKIDQSLALNESAPEHPLRIRLNLPAREGEQAYDDGAELKLVGVDVPEVVPAGTLVDLRLRFALHSLADVVESPGNAVAHAGAELTWIDQHGNSAEAQVVESWNPSRFSLRAPDSLGDYDLHLAILDGRGKASTAHCGWLARPATSCRVATVRVVAPSTAALANYDGKMLLLDAELDLAELPDGSAMPLSPRQSIPVTLYWEGLQSMDKDYTVSVQLVGPDGQLHGQSDGWPVQGTLPTSLWSPGEHITDPYQVVLTSDAPSGHYQVGVVVYLLETQSRLPLVDQSGKPIGNIKWVSEIDVVSE